MRPSEPSAAAAPMTPPRPQLPGPAAIAGRSVTPATLADLWADLVWPKLLESVRLALRRVQLGRDVDLLTAHEIDIATAKRRPKVAFDGEKRRMLAPLSFRIKDHALSIIVPDAADKVSV